MSKNKTLGDIVRSAREERNWSQTALANRIAVSKQTVIAVEKNQRNPTYEVFCRLVHALDISADRIIYPDRVPYTMEQEQFIRELLACGEREQKIAITTLRTNVNKLGRKSTIRLIVKVEACFPRRRVSWEGTAWPNGCRVER